MRNIFITGLAIIGLLSSCNSQKAVQVNGEVMELEDGLYAKLATNQGDILLELNMDKTPITTANFVALAEGNHPMVNEKYAGQPFYDSLTFHRVIPNFMIQGGDPDGTGSGGPGYQFPDETDTDLSHDKGVISMANAGPGTNGSQFFITVAETPHLNGRHTVFGKVKAGQNIADAISQVPTGANDKPQETVVMNTVEIIRKGQAAKNFDAAATFKSAMEEKAAAEKKKQQEMQEKLQSYKAEADSTESGLYYMVEQEGEGAKPEQGQTVLVNYAGYLVDGSLFDSNIEEVARENGKFNPKRPYQPFEVQVGPAARVIPGWKEAIGMMRVGDKWRLITPPHLAYGPRGYPPVIPPNSWLIFDVEMISIKAQGQ